MRAFYKFYKLTALVFTIAILGLSCACCEAADIEELLELDEMVVPGTTDFARPEITMLVMHHENGNIIEIPQLTWENEGHETPDGRSINEKILAFASGYQDYAGGHQQGFSCKIQTVAYYKGMEAVIVMQKAFNPSHRTDPETKAFHYNYVHGYENTDIPLHVLKYDNTHTPMAEEEFRLEEIKALVIQSAVCEGLTVESGELAAYVSSHIGDLYFCDVTVKDAKGVSDVLSRAYLYEFFVYDRDPGEVMTGEEAFSRLKHNYPNLPPIF